MGRFERRFERLEDIERTLARHPNGLTTGQLARMYGVDPSTIHRDVGAMERRGTGLLKHGRRWTLDHRRPPSRGRQLCARQGDAAASVAT